MRRFAMVLGFGLLGLAPALAFDADIEAVIDHMKTGKAIPIADVGTLMSGAERWGYNQDGSNCMWSDIYLKVDAKGAVFELEHAWDDVHDVQFVERGEFRDGRFICETGGDWLPTLRATRRSDGMPLGGRELAALKDEVGAYVTRDANNCFDYLFEGADPAADTVSLLQRQYTDGVYQDGADAKVTLHFDADTAQGLSFY